MPAGGCSFVQCGRHPVLVGERRVEQRHGAVDERAVGARVGGELLGRALSALAHLALAHWVVVVGGRLVGRALLAHGGVDHLAQPALAVDPRRRGRAGVVGHRSQVCARHRVVRRVAQDARHDAL